MCAQLLQRQINKLVKCEARMERGWEALYFTPNTPAFIHFPIYVSYKWVYQQVVTPGNVTHFTHLKFYTQHMQIKKIHVRTPKLQ
jgi:hypothetical protein